MNKLRVGVVGAGTIAHMFHLQNYANHPEVELAAIADKDLSLAEKAAAQYGEGIAVYSSAEEMFAKERLDAVSICTFNRSHVDLSIQALEYGLDVLVEKPMAMSVAEADRLVAKQRETGRVVMVGMSHRYRADAQALQGLVEAGEMGRIYYAKTRILRRRGVPLGWFTNKELSGGGPMMDIGVHVLDLVWWMMGKPEPDKVVGKLFREVAPYATKHIPQYEATSKDNKEEHVYDVEDMGTAFITFKNGAVLTVEVSWAVNGAQDDAVKLELYGTKGGATLDPLMVYKESNQVMVEEALKVPANDFYKDEIDHFVDCVRTRKTPLSDAVQGREIVSLLEAIRVSSETNDIVKL